MRENNFADPPLVLFPGQKILEQDETSLSVESNNKLLTKVSRQRQPPVHYREERRDEAIQGGNRGSGLLRRSQ